MYSLTIYNEAEMSVDNISVLVYELTKTLTEMGFDVTETGAPHLVFLFVVQYL